MTDKERVLKRLRTAIIVVFIVFVISFIALAARIKFLDVYGTAPTYWEPGATFKTEIFAIKNNGNLNLKFKLDIRGAKISEGKLNEVIAFTLVNSKNETESYPIANTGADNTVLMQDIALSPEAVSDYYYIKATMSSDAGNDYQGLTLSGLNIVVYATQMTGEYDINGNDYDKDATYDDEVVLVSNADEFVAAFVALESDQIISLTGDIDMTGKTWTPVNNKGFVLKGNGHTVTGLNGPLVGTTAALEYTIQDVTFKNLTADGVYGGIAIGGVIAYADTCAYINMTNVTIDGATIGGAEYVGGFVGYTSGYGVDTNGPVNASHNFINCTIKNSTLTSSTDGSVGGLIGHAGSNPATTTRVNGFTYSGLALKNDSRPDKTGNMIGTANVGVVYINDEDIDVTYDIGRFVPSTTGKLFINGVDTPEFDGKGVEDLTVVFPDSTMTADGKVENEEFKTLMDNGADMVDFAGAEVDYYYGASVKASVVKNMNSKGLYTINIQQDTVFENCTFTGNPYAFQVDNGNGYTITFKNCTFDGWTSFATTVTNVDFVNCTFQKVESGYGVVRFYQNGSFTKCIFADSFQWTDTCVNGITITVTDCTGLTSDKIFYNTNTSATWIVDGTTLSNVTTHRFLIHASSPLGVRGNQRA